MKMIDPRAAAGPGDWTPERISRERERLADICRRFELGEELSLHPQYADLLVLLDQEKRAAQNVERHLSRMGADAVVPFAEAADMRRLGRLVNEGHDRMLLHTRQAYRLFVGRAASQELNQAAIVGGKRAAACLRAVFGLSGQNNPYADWQLLVTSESLASALASLKAQTKQCVDLLDAQRNRGLDYSLLRSNEPKYVGLEFGSPYGFLIAELTVEYDYFVRHVLTLVRKAVWDDKGGRETLVRATRLVRRVFHDILRIERALVYEHLKPLSRADFLPTGDEAARKRIAAAVQIFGEIPQDVLAGTRRPAHSRAQHVTAQEQALLEALDLAIEPGPEESAQQEQGLL
ncbi:MAG: TIGR03761 family integrating conjugative element protein [Rhodocyclaceae bacterium]|nr:TIGR03761 family integrating conjugative element protein [Rhodocyclaceae bacterium]